jgi:hypothetical protein
MLPPIPYEVKANLKMVLAKAKTGECRVYRDIVIHVGTNNVRMKQSEVTQKIPEL